MQWLTFGILAFVGFGYTAASRPASPREEREEEDGGPTEPVRDARREAKEHKRNRASEEEDALLDRMGI
ncbi:hypothetical protein M8J71_22955 [Pseudarthrobacter sp. R1]|uniref:hypothetical protein n=1 Tax=Pseudarthrobacter sp. R1 TaxID=2944934 RepID=UPI00210E5420|nr:hypothetical protein [Pseudarthrobacter sp. R1]MCQ6273307.1 hypothetical protein [Pseudarthrobacter sp. R1]